MIDHPLHIRKATPADASALARLAGQLGYEVTDAEIRERLPLLPEADVVFAAEFDGEVVGWMHMTVHRTLLDEPVAFIFGLVVDERRRSQGIGAQLLRTADAYAMAQGVGVVSVRSNVIRERAHAFYRRAGFRETKRQVALIRPLERPEPGPEIAMEVVPDAGDAE